MSTCEHLPAYTRSKNGDGRTLWTSPDGFVVVRATGNKRGAPWCVHVNGKSLYAMSLKDAAGVISRLPWRCPDCGNEMRFNHSGCKVTPS